MLVQEILVWIAFALAAAYIVSVFFRQANSAKKGDCGKGCSACNSIDFQQIEKRYRQEHAQVYDA